MAARNSFSAASVRCWTFEVPLQLVAQLPVAQELLDLVRFGAT